MSIQFIITRKAFEMNLKKKYIEELSLKVSY